MTKTYTLEDFRRWGSKGGKKTVRKYGKKKLAEWGKMASKPKKRTLGK